MTDRLASLDASFLYMEDATTPMHVGSVLVFEPEGEGSDSGTLDYDEVVQIIADRIATSPRYRQVIRHVPGRLAAPVWVDDRRFDITYHVRRAALPKPGNANQLGEFVGRVQSRLLDRARPLWEVYLLEGLEGGRFAIITKAHHALVDGINAIDIADLIVEDAATAPGQGARHWRAKHAPSEASLVVGALLDGIRRPGSAIESLRGGLDDVGSLLGRVGKGLGDLGSTLMRASTRPAPQSPLNRTIGEARRFVMVDTDLDDYRTVRRRLPRGNFAEEVTTHDVILATITGALRIWMLTRGEPVRSGTTVRALVPMSIEKEDDSGNGHPAGRIDACIIDLPIGEPSASMRLHQIAFAMRQQSEGGRAIAAQRLSGVAGFGSPTIQSLAARAGSAMSRRLFNVSITNVPGPQDARYVGGAQMVRAYPVMPLAKGQALAIGLVSYKGKVCYGLNADRASMSDLAVIGGAIPDALEELLGAHRTMRRKV
ncbi:MAG: wax ester/triacylglycerol synthase family O-acyltransferase [Dermatophilaceae bacterium]|nr:wax ester/triacylglycerol synthase family O-acyltransferase [Intrasporangiaceae bacterium]